MQKFLPATNYVRHVTYKDFYPSVLSSKVVNKIFCATCNASYVGQVHQHLTGRINEHFGKDKKLHIYQHLMSSTDCLLPLLHFV